VDGLWPGATVSLERCRTAHAPSSARGDHSHLGRSFGYGYGFGRSFGCGFGRSFGLGFGRSFGFGCG
jgi:hypothetical protein